MSKIAYLESLLSEEAHTQNILISEIVLPGYYTVYESDPNNDMQQQPDKVSLSGVVDGGPYHSYLDAKACLQDGRAGGTVYVVSKDATGKITRSRASE